MSQKKETIVNLPYIPEFEELSFGLNSYLETNRNLFQDELKLKYNSDDDIPLIEDTFVENFIDSMASLFSNDFTRQCSIDSNLEELLTSSEQWAERYLHLFRKTAILLDPNNRRLNKRIETLDPLSFFSFEYENEQHYFIRNNGTTFFYQKKDIVEIWQSKESFITCITGFNINHESMKEMLIKNNFVKNKETFPIMPVIEWSYYRNRTATVNPICYLEKEQVLSMSIAVSKGNNHQFDQNYYKTSKSVEDVKDVAEGYGKPNTVLILDENDELGTHIKGNLSSVKDITDVYGTLITKKALTKGVDSKAVTPTTKVESGEALRIKMTYIEKRRKKFMTSAKMFERELVTVMQEVGFNISDYKGIKFHDLQLKKDRDKLNETLKNEINLGFITYAEAYSEKHEISIDDAKQEIKKKNLSFMNNYLE